MTSKKSNLGKTINEEKKDNRISFIALLVCLSIHLYWTFPTYMFSINSQTSEAKIEELDKSLLKYSYFNKFTSSSYEVTRDVTSSEYSKLNGKNKLKVIYPKWLPDSVIVEELERKPTILWPLIFHSFIILGLFKIGKSLIKGN